MCPFASRNERLEVLQPGFGARAPGLAFAQELAAGKVRALRPASTRNGRHRSVAVPSEEAATPFVSRHAAGF